jgi:hypothetical protein
MHGWNHLPDRVLVCDCCGRKDRHGACGMSEYGIIEYPLPDGWACAGGVIACSAVCALGALLLGAAAPAPQVHAPAPRQEPLLVRWVR